MMSTSKPSVVAPFARFVSTRALSPKFVARLAAFGLALTAVSFAPARAEAQGRVVTISEVTIVGRVQKPIAAVDVSRIQPKLTLAELRQNFSERIEKALYRAPF